MSYAPPNSSLNGSIENAGPYRGGGTGVDVSDLAPVPSGADEVGPLLSVRQAATLLSLDSDVLREAGRQASKGGAPWPQLLPRGWFAPAEEWSQLLTAEQLVAHQLTFARRTTRVASPARPPGQELRVASPINGRCPRCSTILRRSRVAGLYVEGFELTCVCGYSWS